MGKNQNGKPKLTAKQAAFVREYVIDFNATQAAIRAGYSEHTANEIGCQNLAKVNIQAALAEKIEKAEQKQEVTRERIIAELAKMGFAKENTKLKKESLDSLARINGMFDDRLRHSVGNDTIDRLAADLGVSSEEAREQYEATKAKYDK